GTYRGGAHQPQPAGAVAHACEGAAVVGGDVVRVQAREAAGGRLPRQRGVGEQAHAGERAVDREPVGVGVPRRVVDVEVVDAERVQALHVAAHGGGRPARVGL